MKYGFRETVVLLATLFSTAAMAETWHADPISGCGVHDESDPKTRIVASWSGGCDEKGHASGEGVLSWIEDGQLLEESGLTLEAARLYEKAHGLAPDYEAAHLGYDAHDYQHFIRYTRAPKVLVWLANDSLAADDLRMQAENFHLSYHQHANTSSGQHQSSGMRGALETVAALPGAGFAFGRGESWGFDCALAAYALGDDAWRARKLPWFRLLGRLVADGQGACTGFLQAQVVAQFAQGRYRGRQAIEESIAQNMLQGLRQTVFRDFDHPRSDLVRGVLERSLHASVSDMAWFPGETAPWVRTGIGPADPSAPVWCSPGQMPADAYVAAHERFQNASSLAYGYELTGNPLFLEKARLLTGALDLLSTVQDHGLENLENRAALIALAQHLFSGQP